MEGNRDSQNRVGSTSKKRRDPTPPEAISTKRVRTDDSGHQLHSSMDDNRLTIIGPGSSKSSTAEMKHTLKDRIKELGQFDMGASLVSVDSAGSFLGAATRYLDCREGKSWPFVDAASDLVGERLDRAQQQLDKFEDWNAKAKQLRAEIQHQVNTRHGLKKRIAETAKKSDDVQNAIEKRKNEQRNIGFETTQDDDEPGASNAT